MATAALLTNGSGTGTTSYDSASVTLTADAIVTVFIFKWLSVGSSDDPTVTGHSLTWTLRTAARASATRQLYVYETRATGSSGIITMASSANWDATWIIVESTGVATGALARAMRVVDWPTAAANATSYTGFLQTFNDVDNIGLCAVFSGINQAHTPAAGWTELADQVGGGTNGQMSVMWRTGHQDTWGASWASSASRLGIGTEIRDTASSTFGPVSDLQAHLLDCVSNASSGTTIATGAVSLTAGKLVIAVVSGGRSTGASDPSTVASPSVSFTKITVANSSIDWGTGGHRTTLWVANPGSTVSEAVTATWAVSQDNGRRIHLSYVDGTDLSVSAVDAIVQCASSATTSNTTLSATLGAFGDTRNGTFAVVTTLSLQSYPTMGAGFQPLVDPSRADAGVSRTTWGEWRASNDTSVDMTWPTASAASLMAFEVKGEVAAPVVSSLIFAPRPLLSQIVR